MNGIKNIMDDFQKQLNQNNTYDSDGNSITSNLSSSTMEIKQTNVVKYNEKYESVVVYEKDIKRIKSICKDVKESHITAADFCLAIASLLAGAFISAFVSGVPLENGLKPIILYIVSPSIACGCGVAFFLTRKHEQTSAKSLADHVLEYLPDINEQQEGSNDNES